MQCAIYQNVLDKENLVLITIGEPTEKTEYSQERKLSDEEVKGFKDALMVNFWDIEEDFGDYKIITDEQGKKILS